MRLEVAAIACRINLGAWSAREPGVCQRIAQRRAFAIMACIDLRLRQQPAERTAADERSEMPFLVCPCCDIDATPKCARDFEPIDHAECTVQPPGMRLRLDMAAEQKFRTAIGRTTDDIAYAVNLRLEPSLCHPRSQPMARLHIFRRIGRPMHPGLVSSDLAQRVEIAQQPVTIDARRHGASVIPCGRISPSGVGVKPETLSDSAHSHFAWYRMMCGRSAR